MKKIIPLLLILSACATQSNYRKGASEEVVKLEDDYSWVDQLNFDKKSESKYQADKDEFNIASEENGHALVKESLSNLSSARLEETLAKADNVLTKINIKCYHSKHTAQHNNLILWLRQFTC